MALPADPAPRVLARPEHPVSRSQISQGALKVLYRLRRFGYLAYLVGGGVRDLMLGRTPKDFDVVTNARPREVRRLFGNSRIIGRRFRLVHVFFSDGIVEVSTFRASPEAPDDWESDEGPEEESQDPWEDSNLFGTPAEDARRRDLTVNALFYNIEDFSIIDHVGGIDDLERRTLRVIGEPELRFREDPVRMMRTLEYKVRLDFELDRATEEAIRECREALLETPPARLTYELLEGLKTGMSADILAAWREFGILGPVFPHLDGAFPALVPILAAVDDRVRGGGECPEAVLLGATFLPEFIRRLAELEPGGQSARNPVILDMLRELTDVGGPRLVISKHNLHLLRHSLFAWVRMRHPPDRGRQVVKLTRQEYFPVAWELLTIGTSAGLFPTEVRRSWAEALTRLKRGAEPVEGDDGRSRRGRRPRRRRRPRRKRTA